MNMVMKFVGYIPGAGPRAPAGRGPAPAAPRPGAAQAACDGIKVIVAAGATGAPRVERFWRDTSYEALCAHVRAALAASALATSGRFAGRFTYMDEEGEEVTVSCEASLRHAVAFFKPAARAASSYLRLEAEVGGGADGADAEVEELD